MVGIAEHTALHWYGWDLMAVTIDSSSGWGSYADGRHVARLSTGRLLAVVYSSTPRLEIWYSDDNGGTWTENTAARASVHANFAATSYSFTLFVDVDDNVHLAYLGGGLDSYTYLWYRCGATVGTGGAFGSEYEVFNNWGSGNSSASPSMVAHRDIAAGSGWKVHIAHAMFSATNVYVQFRTLTVNTSYSVTANTTTSPWTGALGPLSLPRIDFYHTGDGKTIQGSTPHLFLAFPYTSGLGFMKYTYSGGSWSAGTLRQLDAGATTVHDAAFDGTRFNVAYALTGTPTVLSFAERDAADTTTTARTPTALSDGNIGSITVTHQGADRSVVVGAIGATSNDAKYSRFDRTAGTWGSWTALQAGTATVMSAAAGTLGRRADFVWHDTGNLVHGQVVFNTAPGAPAWVTPTDFAGADVGAALPLDWTPNDPDLDEVQTAYAVRRQIGAGTLYYWRASDSTWQTTETKNTSATSALTLAAGWGADGDANHKFVVKTWDILDAEGVYGAELTVVPSVPSNPTLTVPADGGTVTTATLVAAWTVADQAAYRVELLTTGDVVLWDSEWVPSTTADTQTAAYTLVNGTGYKCRLTTTNSENLACVPVVHEFDCTYTPPATPTVTVTAHSALGKITVAHTNPAPVVPVVVTAGGSTVVTAGGSTVVTEQETPTVISADIFVRCATGAYPAGERPVGGDGIRVATGITPGADWIDWAAPSGREQEYLVRVWAADDTYTDSAWTA